MLETNVEISLRKHNDLSFRITRSAELFSGYYIVGGTEEVSPGPSSPWSCDSDRSRGTPSVSSEVGRSSERARSSGVNPDEEAPVPFAYLCSVLGFCWASILLCLNLAGLLSEHDLMLLEVDGRSYLNSSSSGWIESGLCHLSDPNDEFSASLGSP